MGAEAVSMETTLGFEAFPGRQITVMLFKDVKSPGVIKEAIVAGKLEPEAAFLNAALVPDLFVIHLAAMKALVAHSRNSLKTYSLHSEVVYNVSGSQHIKATLEKWGVSESTPSLAVVRFDATPEEVGALRALVNGTQIPLDTLPELVDATQMKKSYKVSPQELSIGTLADAAAVRIAARDC